MTVAKIACVALWSLSDLPFPITGGGKSIKDGKGRKKKNKAADEEEEEEDTYYDAMKKDMGDRAARTKVCLTSSIPSVQFWRSCWFGMLPLSGICCLMWLRICSWCMIGFCTRHCAVFKNSIWILSHSTAQELRVCSTVWLQHICFVVCTQEHALCFKQQT